MRMRKIISDITAGTPRNLATALGFDPNEPCMALRVFLQMKHGGSSIGSVLQNPKRGAPLAITTDLIAEMAAASTDPGGSYEDSYNGDDQGGIDLSLMAVDVGTTNDPVILNADLKV